jgi:hypothetical protein
MGLGLYGLPPALDVSVACTRNWAGKFFQVDDQYCSSRLEYYGQDIYAKLFSLEESQCRLILWSSGSFIFTTYEHNSKHVYILARTAKWNDLPPCKTTLAGTCKTTLASGTCKTTLAVQMEEGVNTHTVGVLSDRHGSSAGAFDNLHNVEIMVWILFGITFSIMLGSCAKAKIAQRQSATTGKEQIVFQSVSPAAASEKTTSSQTTKPLVPLVVMSTPSAPPPADELPSYDQVTPSPELGKEPTMSFCPKCGQKTVPGCAFCGHCGFQIPMT